MAKEKEIDGIPVHCAYVKLEDIERVIPNPRNPNTHNEKQLELLAKIIGAQGWRTPITVSTNSGFIVRGHGRLKAAQILGLTKVPVDYQDYASEAEEWADLIADNRIAELSEWDMPMLKDMLEELDTGALDIELTGFTDEEMERLMTQFHVEELEEDDFDAEAAAKNIKEPVTKPGDIWQLGRHRLMCGDATSFDAVDKLVAGNKVNLIVTDPPYNVDYVGKTKDALKIKNDKMNGEKFFEFLFDAFSNAFMVAADGAPIYIFHADTEGLNFRRALIESGFKLAQCCVWVKQSMVMGRQDYQWQHEPILYGWKEGAAHKWYSDRKQTTVWNFNRPSRSKEHPTMKPLDLVAYPIKNSSVANCIVFDSFGGSGSTLIACEQLNRICYTLELDPVYCDVIIQRWETLTGEKAELVRGE